MEIQLGSKVRDIITGFSGVVTGIVHYLTGCNQALVVPKVKDDGAYKEAQWFDLQRLVLEDNTIVELPPMSSSAVPVGFDKEAPKR